MHVRIFWPALLLIAFSAPTFAASYEGIFHNDRDRHRATLDTGGALYELDFQGSDLYHSAERFDRDRAIVWGTLSYSRYSDLPVLVVDRVTFRPYGLAVTYDIRPSAIERRVYTRRPVRYWRGHHHW